MRNRPFLDRKAALERLLREAKAGILLNEHIAEDGATVFPHPCGLAPRASSRSGSTAPTGPPLPRLDQDPQSCQARPCQRERSEIWNRGTARDNWASRLTAAVMICSGKS
jgi:hypothetical protein